MASVQRSSGRLQDVSPRMLISMPVQRSAVARWVACKSFIGRHHLLVMLLAMSTAIRAPETRSVLFPISLLHLLAWACCLSNAPAYQRRMHTAASLCGILTWVLRFMVHQRLLLERQLPVIFERAFTTSTWPFASDVFVFSLEMVYALMWMPPVIATGLFAVHLRVYYQLVKRVTQPSLIATAAWVLANVAVPHLMHYYMHKAAQLREAQLPTQDNLHAAGTPEAAASCKQAPAIGEGKGKTADGTDWAPAPAEGVGEPCPLSATRATAAVGLAGAGSRADTGHCHEHPAVPVTISAQAMQVASPHGLAPSPHVLRALQNAQALKQCASCQYTYRSRLTQAQVVVKLQHAEPEQLRQEVIAAVNTAMNQGRAGMLTIRAGVRHGCILLVLDLLQRSGDQAAGQPAGSLLPAGSWEQTGVQALLGSLLAPGTPLPDRAVAYVQMGGEEVQAVWQQDTATWVVTDVASERHSATNKSVTASLLFVDHPVVRLHPQAVRAEPGSSSSMHRVSLLLETNQALLFTGSDPSSSAPPDQPADSNQVSVQCVARGCWGTCLTVAVAGVEVQEAQGGEEHDGHSSLAALTLDVDLSQPPSAGSVQLELWCGRALLASAPLLLLPKSSNSSFGDSDLLLEELQQCAGEIGWSEGAQSDGTKPSSGAAALLTDLGQVLYSLECVQMAAGGQANSLSSINNGPSSSWGGIVAGLAAQHASDPDTLSGVISICDGLLEYFQEQGHTHTADVLSGCAERLQQRLQQVQQQGTGASAMAAAAAATAGLRLNALTQAVWMRGSTGRLARMAHAPSVGSSVPPGAATLWARNTSLFATYHLLCVLLALSTCVRAASQRCVTASLFAVHVTAWYCCREGRSNEQARRLQTTAGICGVLSWSLRTLAHYRWSAGLPLTPVLQTALGTSFVWPAETFMCLLETVHALMLFPSALVSLLLAVHLSVVYSSIKTVQGQSPNTLHTAIWVLVNFVGPYVVRYHLRTTAQAQAQASTHAAGEASMCSAAPASSTPAGRLTHGRASTKLA